VPGIDPADVESEPEASEKTAQWPKAGVEAPDVLNDAVIEPLPQLHQALSPRENQRGLFRFDTEIVRRLT